jgi:hypothetical protein
VHSGIDLREESEWGMVEGVKGRGRLCHDDNSQRKLVMLARRLLVPPTNVWLRRTGRGRSFGRKIKFELNSNTGVERTATKIELWADTVSKERKRTVGKTYRGGWVV